MLYWRLVGAAAILLPLSALVWLDDQLHAGRPGIWLALVGIGVSLLACREMTELLRNAGLATVLHTNALATLCVVGTAMVPIFHPHPKILGVGQATWIVAGFTLAALVTFGSELWRYQEGAPSIARIASSCMCALYLGLPIACLAGIRVLPPSRNGLVGVLATMLTVKLSDIGAYLVGRLIGRTHFSRISPGKTLEGVAGGIAFAMLGSLVLRDAILPQVAPQVTVVGSRGMFLAFGASLALIGLGGDLAESILKRNAHLKDSSHWLPGLGGMLDVLDSIYAVSPLGLLWWSSNLLITF